MKQTTATNLVAKKTWEKSKENVMAVEATSNRHSECQTGTEKRSKSLPNL